MKTTVNSYDFDRAFTECRPSSFSHAGRKALFEYLEQTEEDIGEEFELDVIAICCDFTEYEDIAEFNKNYNTEYENMREIDETTVIDIDGESFIIQNY